MLEIILILIIAIIIFYALFVLIYKKIKKMIIGLERNYKDTVSKELTFLAAIENRICKPFKEFDTNRQKEDWLVIFSYKRMELLIQTVRTAKANEPDIKILVIDNGSPQDLIDELNKLFQDGLINKLILNHNNEVLQWQKCFSIAQAFKILSLESVHSITFSDDDILVEKPWLKDSDNLLQRIPDAIFISLMTDSIQEKVHKTISELTISGETVRLKKSFIGTFFYLPISAIDELGMPPFNEGIYEASVEDWFYSRLVESKGKIIPTINRCQHLGYASSIREAIEKENEQNARN